MKTQIQIKPAREQGSMLLVTLIIAVVLGTTLSSYLVLVTTQEKSVNRSQNWNGSLAMAEAGVEEGLAQLSSSYSNLTANGWGGGTNGVYGPVSRSITGGSYSVMITAGAVPTLYSTGYVTLPVTGQKLSRTIAVTTQSQGIVPVAFAAINNIQFNGNGLATDSWNSHTNTLSTNGAYDSTKTSNHGSVASEYGLVNIGNHSIAGNLYLGPTATYDSTAGQVLGTIYYDYNVQFPDVTLPSTTWLPASTTTTGGNGNKSYSYHDFTMSGDYQVSDGNDIVVEAGVTVRVKVTTSSWAPANLTINGGMTNSGTIKVYQVSGTSDLSGNITVSSNRPENLWYYGLPGVTTITWGGTSAFIGVIYAPEANFTLNGGGNNNNLMGSSVTKTITMNGHYDFHYDESLATQGAPAGYVVKSWQEL